MTPTEARSIDIPIRATMNAVIEEGYRPEIVMHPRLAAEMRRAGVVRM